MKICLISMPRSRSSVLLSTISLYHKIPIIGQDINDYRYDMDNFLSNNFLEKKGVIRFHPTHLIPNLKTCDSIVNLDLMKFSQYDKIYFTHRNSIVDYICSYIIADYLGKFTYYSTNDLEDTIPSMTFSLENSKHYKFLKWHVYSELLINLIKKYLLNLNIPYNDLYYDSIPLYIKNNYSNVKINNVETNYNYKKIFINYDEIESLYYKLKIELEKEYHDCFKNF